jgi:hypothetical protein
VKKDYEAKAEAATEPLSPECIGELCSQVVAKYTKPNINARTMLGMPEFWADITLALRGETPPEIAGDPILTSLDPATAEVGSADTTLRCIGLNFTESSIIIFNSGEEPTTFVSSTEITTGLKPSTASGPYTVPVSVRSGEVYSNPVDFTFTAAPVEDAVVEEEDAVEAPAWKKEDDKPKSKRRY